MKGLSVVLQEGPTPEIWLLEELRNLRAGGEGGGKGEDAHKCLRHKLGLPQSCDDF